MIKRLSNLSKAIPALAFIGACLSYALYTAVGVVVEAHGDDEKAHPVLMAQISETRNEIKELTTDLRHTRDIMALVQVGNTKEHERISTQLSDIAIAINKLKR